MKKTRAILLCCFVMLFLSGCDPCNPMGLRNFGSVENSQNQDSKLIALAPYWGPCGYQPYFTTDGGLTWKIVTAYPKIGEVLFSWRDCTEACEFTDSVNGQIQYKINPGKLLSRSMDGGNTWKEELRVPAWNQMEKNWVNYKFQDIGGIPRDIRGPFGAITDPKTGNLIVAMGFEGILVFPENGNWSWINVDGFGKIEPSRSDMLGLILIQDWVRVPLIAIFVFLFGISKLGFNKYRFIKTIFMILAAWFILIPNTMTYLLIYVGLPWADKNILDNLQFQQILQLVPAITIIFSLISIALLNIRSKFYQIQPIIHKIAVVSILSAIGYWFSFVSWSQGILLTEYTHAYIIGVILFFTALFIVSRVTRERIYHLIQDAGN